jgi:hypothetical protein
MEFIPASLERPKWQARCSIEGLEPVRKVLEEKRGVLLVFPHFSLYGQIRNRLRGAGLPVAFFAGADSTLRSELKRHKDRWALFPEVPTVFSSDELAGWVVSKASKLLVSRRRSRPA